MGRRRRYEPVVDAREVFVSRLIEDAASVRRELTERRREFWSVHARVAAEQLAACEAEALSATRHDQPGCWLREATARRALNDACFRAGLAADALLAAARAEVARKADGAAAGNGAQEAGDAQEEPVGAIERVRF